MNKIILIIQREYLTRVKKRSFIVMTILGPLLMASLMIVPIYLATVSDKTHVIQVVDETGIFFNKFRDADKIKFKYVLQDINVAKEALQSSGDYAVLYIPKTEIAIPENAIIYSDKQPSLTIKEYISNTMQKEIEKMKMKASGLDETILQSIKANVKLSTIKLEAGGEEKRSYTEVSMVLGMFAGIMIYFFIFLFGSQVMRGVIEEKTSRIVEVIISSVKPFQLMMGKIIGVALVGLTQFLLWVVLTFAIVTVFKTSFPDKFSLQNSEQKMISSSQLVPATDSTTPKADEMPETQKIMEAIASVDFGVMIAAFIFYFLFGYLLYAALFAAIGSAVDNEADTQQFMLPVTIPLIFAIVMAQYVINNPDGPLSFWLSIIPLTSPIIMIIRIPFGVPFTDLALSVVLLILGFFACTWLAGKIYRTGILMYGKKVDYKELWKWISYKG
ncbi:MAG: ABC transporter permease [Lentimicrobiaceae bacterium]|nr:ABC transporter permease [Lentimicrobiaceae bacterium]